MGTFKHNIEIGDFRGERYEPVEAVVGTRASFTLVPGAMLERLGVLPIRRSTFVAADGNLVERDLGQTWIRVDGRAEFGVVVFGVEGDKAALGMNTLQGLLLVVDPDGKRLVTTMGRL